MDVKTASIFVENQSNALTFYTDILAFGRLTTSIFVNFVGSGSLQMVLARQNCSWSSVRIQRRKPIRKGIVPMAYRQLFSSARIFT